MQDEKYMAIAIKQAEKALKLNEIPVGAVIVKNDEIISFGFNLREKLNNSLAHAEIVAINLACKKLKSWRILNSTIYVTLQPCLMCLGAILNAKIERLVFAATNKNLTYPQPDLTKHLTIEQGVLKNESEQLLNSFFKTLRKK